MENLIKKYRQEVNNLNAKLYLNPQISKIEKVDYTADKARKTVYELIIKDLETETAGVVGHGNKN